MSAYRLITYSAVGQRWEDQPGGRLQSGQQLQSLTAIFDNMLVFDKKGRLDGDQSYWLHMLPLVWALVVWEAVSDAAHGAFAYR